MVKFKMNMPLIYIWFIVALSAISCKKVGLHEDYGQFKLASSYWYEREKVAYVFFSVSELPERLMNSAWTISYEEEITDNVPSAKRNHSFVVDFTKGVHWHEQVACGADTVCASYSFPSEHPIRNLQVQLLYDSASELALTIEAEHRNAYIKDGQGSYSALIYGVFEKENEYVQPRIYNNFGSPSDSDVASYGMIRRFAVSQPVLAATEGTPPANDPESIIDDIFPAQHCSINTDPLQFEFDSTQRKWITTKLDRSDPQPGVCFNAELRDKSNQTLVARSPAKARRNPVLSEPNLRLNTPLRTGNQIHIHLEYCKSSPYYASLIDEDFRTYQQFILGMKDSTVDACFEVGKEQNFRTSLATALAQKLSNAKTNSTNDKDFFFIVLFHEKLTSEFRNFHLIVASELNKIIELESANISPRLAGAFVYTGNAEYKPPLSLTERIIWCPQELPDSIASDDISSQNCTLTPTGKLDLGIINFVAPLGPLPSQQQYSRYVDRYGDFGLARSPKLFLDSLPANLKTREEKGKQITFFESQALNIPANSNIKICFDRAEDVNLLAAFRFRDFAQTPAQEDSLDVVSAQQLWLSDEAEGTYDIGLKWDFPFRGGIHYRGRISGSIASIAPFQRSFSALEPLGSPMWEISQWDLGKYLQRCSRYCSHPFFDEHGTYQLKQSWRTYATHACFTPLYPEFNQ